jgi:hypothetical protein
MLQPSDNDWTTAPTLSFQDRRRVFLVGIVMPTRADSSLVRVVESLLDSLAISPGRRCRPTAGVGARA